MTTFNFNANIEVDEIMAQLRAESDKKMAVRKSDYDPKRYLQASLGKDEQEKQLIIRLLPFSPNGGSPFHKVHMHTIKVNNEVSKSGWKTISCPRQNPESDADKKYCPFCEAAITARQVAKTSSDEAKKKRFNDIAFANSANEMWVVRCIERGKEDEGVKFWLFPNPKNGGIYQTIMNIYNTRKEAGERKGEVRNIFDLSNGKDLIVTIKRGADGKRKIDIVDDDDFSPLTTNMELGNKWISDETKWTDLYPFKRADYMEVLVGNGVPYFDKEKIAYIDKEVFIAGVQSVKEEKEREQQSQLTAKPVDYSTPKPIESVTALGQEISNVTSKSKPNTETVAFSVSTDVTPTEVSLPFGDILDDLPF